MKSNLFLITKNNELCAFLAENGCSIKSADEFYNGIYDDIQDFETDIVIIDEDCENSKMNLSNLAIKNTNKDFEIFYLMNESNLENFNDNDIKLILKPLNNKILLNEINTALAAKNNLKELKKENLELKKNLYQIDAFYNASSKFAGTLDKEKLYEIMFETFDRVLSFDIACALIKDNIKNNEIKFYINSLKKTTPELNHNLTKRLIIAAKEENLTKLKLNDETEIITIQNVKPSYKNEFYSNQTADFDTLFAPVIIKDKLEGIIEIFRKNPFSKEDVTCFQSIIHQVLAPLRSAILYEDIIKANKELKELERMKSEFVSIVSHELRTPLTPINNALSIILSEQGGKIGDINKNFANIAKRNVSRLSGIIEDLLDLSRMQTGKFEFNLKKTGVSSSLELAYNTFKNQAQNKNIEFVLNKADPLPDCYIDPHRLDQILSNLITNALKFTPDGGKIEIKAELTDGESIPQTDFVAPSLKEYKGEYIQISVKDTGVGIDTDDIPKIFDKFSQIENTLSRNTGGIGLGLTITKHFIDVLMGAIRVNSKKNEGSTFSFIIPVYDEKKAFKAELNLKIKNDSETGYIKITENQNCSFYNELKNSNIIKLTKHSKELSYNADDKCITEVFISDLEKNAFEFMISKIEEQIKSKDNNCGIVLSKMYYKKDTI